MRTIKKTSVGFALAATLLGTSVLQAGVASAAPAAFGDTI
jgi:hypothetical protein